MLWPHSGALEGSGKVEARLPLASRMMGLQLCQCIFLRQLTSVMSKAPLQAALAPNALGTAAPLALRRTEAPMDAPYTCTLQREHHCFSVRWPVATPIGMVVHPMLLTIARRLRHLHHQATQRGTSAPVWHWRLQCCAKTSRQLPD